MEKDDQGVYLLGTVVETLKTYALSALFAFLILLFLSFYVHHILLFYLGGIVFLMPVLAPAVSKWRPKKRISVNGKAVFISGCDSGFGFMLAQRLDVIGFHVFAGCLFPEGPGAERLRKSVSKRLHVIGLDVTSDDSVQKAATYVTENLGNNLLWAVVNNAGIAEPGEVSWISMESIKKTIDVNTLGVARITKAFLLKLKESKGRVVSVASLGGRYSLSHFVPYCASKKAVIGFCDGLRLELYKWNIQVITIEPAFYSTPMTNVETLVETYRKLLAKAPKDVRDLYEPDYSEKVVEKHLNYLKYFFRHPREVVSVIEEALTAVYPEYYYTPGSIICRFGCWTAKMLPKPIIDMVILYFSET